MGKLLSNFTQNNSVVHSTYKRSCVNHVCDVITPNFEGKSFHMQRQPTHEKKLHSFL
jgi:hypothetical protein